ncbi:uncharacterized protein [Epargyreus clarus]|uniref:uncharacterized protein isoform X4 n=1 Tax=Epargyreus clarus TaxID=520877 RepID=UPI003C2C252A
MEHTKNDLQLVPNMIMCGDHPSITKTELNAKEKPEEKEKEVKKYSYGRITPTSSQTERGAERGAERAAERMRGVRRRALELAERADVDVHANRALIQAAIGSFRWPPYLLCVWVLVLLLTHALHCLVAVLERALPAVRKLCQYFRAWTEASWRGGEARSRACPLALAAAAGALYALYAALLALHAAALWAIEPLCADDDAESAQLADYTDDGSKIHLNAKQ